MIRLALPGLVMILAEYLAFEILTLSASWISPTHLATQSVLSTISTLAYQIPFPVSIAASTRIANLIGATLSDAAKINAKVSVVIALAIGTLNMIVLSSTRNYIPKLFTSDPEVIELTANTLPLNAAFQLFDALAALMNGILRGLGRQEVGGYVNLFAYYVVNTVLLTKLKQKYVNQSTDRHAYLVWNRIRPALGSLRTLGGKSRKTSSNFLHKPNSRGRDLHSPWVSSRE